jgi:hypothetical protein
VRAGDPNVARVEIVAAALGELCDDVVLVGGCAASLLIDAPSAPPPRVTTDVDLMPTDETVLGFSNRWYAEAAHSATRARLPSGRTLNLISAPAFLGTKFEAFRTRGNGDMLASHDFEDIINVLEGRSRVVEEIRGAPPPLQSYLSAAFGQVVATPSFGNTLPGLVAYDELHEQRVSAVLQCIRAVIALQSPSAA